jgi:hypothetical protein
VISREVDRVKKLLPSPLTFQGGDDVDNLDKGLDIFHSLFSSLEKVVVDKVEIEFLQKKLEEVCKTIEWDKKVLDNSVKEINDCINRGKAFYSKCIHYFSFIQNIVNIIHKEEESLSKMVADYQNLG